MEENNAPLFGKKSASECRIVLSTCHSFRFIVQCFYSVSHSAFRMAARNFGLNARATCHLLWLLYSTIKNLIQLLFNHRFCVRLFYVFHNSISGCRFAPMARTDCWEYIADSANPRSNCSAYHSNPINAPLLLFANFSISSRHSNWPSRSDDIASPLTPAPFPIRIALLWLWFICRYFSWRFSLLELCSLLASNKPFLAFEYIKCA